MIIQYKKKERRERGREEGGRKEAVEQYHLIANRLQQWIQGKHPTMKGPVKPKIRKHINLIH